MKTSNTLKEKGRSAWTFTGLALMLTMAMSSCIIITDNDGGNHGQDGRAYYGIDYDWNPPYSYWDNNSAMPDNPFFGELYRSMDGIYDFEYFVDPYEYWYGTYELFINPGLPGGPHGEDGLDGADTFLLLICNEDGFYYEGWESCDCYRTLDDGTIVIEKNEGDKRYKVTMKKTNIDERPTRNIPKFKKEPAH